MSTRELKSAIDIDMIKKLSMTCENRLKPGIQNAKYRLCNSLSYHMRDYFSLYQKSSDYVKVGCSI